MKNIDLYKNSLKELKIMAGDDEAAHSFEDDLHEKALQEIADGIENPSEIAKEVLKTKKIRFARWCA